MQKPGFFYTGAPDGYRLLVQLPDAVTEHDARCTVHRMFGRTPHLVDRLPDAVYRRGCTVHGVLVLAGWTVFVRE